MFIPSRVNRSAITIHYYKAFTMASNVLLWSSPCTTECTSAVRSNQITMKFESFCANLVYVCSRFVHKGIVIKCTYALFVAMNMHVHVCFLLHV